MFYCKNDLDVFKIFKKNFLFQIKDEVFESKLNEFTSIQKAIEALCDNLENYVEVFEVISF